MQPSRRPADGRFGENPNRLFKHHQFQVILKPAPDEVQQLYLQSLEACGIDLRAHDVRFEEDNWESPTLGAWGIGWQVLFDGQEITQFTYFQQAGGIDLAPISVELTYGLERFAMALQDVDNVFDLEWAPGVKYRDVRHRDEVEQSKYAFGQVDMPPGRVRTRCTAICSTGTTCSAQTLLRVGAGAAGARLLPEVLAHVQPARRERRHRRDRAHGLHPARAAAGRGDREDVRRGRRAASGPAVAKAADSGMDRELLHRDRRRRAARRLAARPDAAARPSVLDARLKELRHRARRAGRELQHAAPPDGARRPKIAERQDGSRGDDHRPAGVGGVRADGQPTPAALGFAKKQGVEFDAARAREDAEGRVPRLSRAHQRGKSAVDVLPDVLGGAAARPRVPEADALGREARGRQGRAAVRPADPLAAVPLRRARRAVHDRPDAERAPGPQVQDVASGALTYGHRFLATSGRAGRRSRSQTSTSTGAAAEHFVILEHAERRDRDRPRARGARPAARRPRAACSAHAALLEEVADLVEYPGGRRRASSTAEFLALPEEVLTTTLIHHQHYFPVVDRRRAS